LRRSRFAFIGSRKKAESLKALLAERGIPHERLAKLKAPVSTSARSRRRNCHLNSRRIVAVQRRKDARGSPPAAA
jgi:hypothetical protein